MIRSTQYSENGDVLSGESLPVTHHFSYFFLLSKARKFTPYLDNKMVRELILEADDKKNLGKTTQTKLKSIEMQKIAQKNLQKHVLSKAKDVSISVSINREINMIISTIFSRLPI